MTSIAMGDEQLLIGDTVSLRPPDDETPPYLARINDMGEDKGGATRVRVSWFYRPEEAHGGRKAFHGEKELFTSDHNDWVAADSIEHKVAIHTLKAYQALPQVGEADYFSRFLYKASTGEFKPDRVPVYCLCEMPYNPDLFMVECEGCSEWFHPECLQLTENQVSKMPHMICSECTRNKKHPKPKPGANPSGGGPPPSKKARK